MSHDPNLEAENRRLEARIEQLLQERTRILARAKREWEQTFDAIPTPIGILTREGTVVRANRAFAERVGHDVRELVGKKCHDVICLRGEPCAECLLRGGDHPTGTFEIRAADGRLMKMEVIEHPDGENRVCVLHDITDERNRLSDVVQLEKMVAMGQLASGIAHEIKNPLASILAFAQIMRREDGRSADDAESLELIEQSAVRCKTIVDTMLRFARRANDQESFDPVAPASDALALFRMFLKTMPKARLEVDLPRTLPPIRANPNHLQQVLLNLLHNAAQALPESGGQIRISSEVNDGWVGLRVADDGIGIPPENLERIFEATFTTKPSGAGTGLGLAIAQRLVSAHDGRIDVRSEPGHGAEFTVRFPIAQEADS